MRSVFGIPAHPLLVHMPTVLLPLAAIGVVLMAIRPMWHERYRWAVLALGFVGAIGAILAAGAGESLANQITAQQGDAAEARWEDHVQAGETARLFAIIFFILLAAYIVVPYFMQRRRPLAASSADGLTEGAPPKSTTSPPKWAGVAMTVLVLAGAAGSVVTVVLAGHNGAKAVWCQTNNPPNC